MRRRLQAPRVLLSALLAMAVPLAGCMGGSEDAGDGGNGGDGGDGGQVGLSDGRGTSGSRSGDPAEEADLERFAVLVADGRLEGEGPPPGPVAACSMAPPDGRIDLDGKQAWAEPGSHSFQAGETWIVVVDRVVVDDPRGTSCHVRKATPFVVDAEWTPQLDADFRLHLFSDGDDLLVGKSVLSPGADLDVHLEFEDDQYTFSGDLTFTHAGWWPNGAFEQRDGDAAPEDPFAVWWD